MCLARAGGRRDRTRLAAAGNHPNRCKAAFIYVGVKLAAGLSNEAIPTATGRDGSYWNFG